MSLWKNSRFTRFFLSFSAGNLGDWLDIFALQVIAVHEFHASPMIMGLLALLYFLPGIVFGPFAGVCADRFSKREVMITTDILSGLITIGLFLSANIFTALLLILIRSSIASLNAPTQQAYIKQVVPEQDLLKASSYTAIVFSFCKIVGPLLGAVILLYFSARSCLMLNALSFILSAFILATLPKDKPLLEVSPLTKSKTIISDFLHDLLDGGKFVWQHKTMRIISGIVMFWFICSMIRLSQLAILLNHLQPNKTNILGYVLGLDGLGAVVSGMMLSRGKHITSYGSYFLFGFLLLSIGNFIMAIYQTGWAQFIFYLAAFILGLGAGINTIAYNYILKKESFEHSVGRVYGINSALQNIGLAIGTILGGFLVIQLGVREAYIILSFLLFALAMVSAFFI